MYKMSKNVHVPNHDGSLTIQKDIQHRQNVLWQIQTSMELKQPPD